MSVAKKNINKKIEEFYQRGLELELQGLDPGVIGSMARFERQRARNRRAQFYRDLAVRLGKSKIKVTVIDQAKSTGHDDSLTVLLELPLKAEGGRKGTGEKAIAAVQAFLRKAVAESIKRHEA